LRSMADARVAAYQEGRKKMPLKRQRAFAEVAGIEHESNKIRAILPPAKHAEFDQKLAAHRNSPYA